MWGLAFFVLTLSGVVYASQGHHRSLLQRAPDNWPIKNGYVAFGDSFGAGMGTGRTSTDACRVGSNNFGELLHKWTNNANVDFQSKVCSGDTSVGLNRQIEEWENPKKADIATISMGGNDLGFSNLVWYCIITPNTIQFPSTTRQECKNAKDKARAHLADMSDSGLRSILKTAYKKVLDKSGRDDFHIYVTGYLGFFNHDDTDCDKTTFHYWWAQYNPPTDPRIVLLNTGLRRELNDLVGQLSSVIQAAVGDANSEHGRDQVHFVDVNPRYDVHRWCEKGDFHEPDPGRQDTWFFLSGWPDVDIEAFQVADDLVEASIEQLQIEDLMKQGSIKLPDAGSCLASLGTDPDPWQLWMCRVAVDVAAEPDGDLAKDIQAANDEISKGDVHGTHIPGYVATRQIKTFHPRSPGMVAYRDAIIEAINTVQVNGAPQSRPTGACKMSIKEIWTCEAVDKNLYADITLTGANGENLYTTGQSTTSPGVPINDNDPLHTKEQGMAQELIIIGEHSKDYIQFAYGDTRWTSGTTDGTPNCKLIGNDWDQGGPSGCPNGMAITRQFDCEYPC